jgi:hypothetical protein
MIFFKYLMLYPDHEPIEYDWINFKDLKDSAPFAEAFVNCTEAPLAKYF